MKPFARWAVPGLWVAILALASWGGIHARRQATDSLPISHSVYLHDVVEPITITRAVFMDDGGSLGVEFQDSRGTTKQFCRVSTLLDQSEGPNYLQFGVMSPRRGLHPVKQEPVSGVQERALLGLLERWVRTEPEAIEIQRDFERRSPNDSWNIRCVVTILNELRARN